MSPLDRLRRTDKWFLGGGKGAIYAPPFPRFLTSPGFWDESFLADVKLPRLFTVLFTESDGRPVDLVGRVDYWRPDVLVVRHESSEWQIEERRCVLERHAWVSEFRVLRGPGGRSLEAFVWSLQDVRPDGFGTPWASLVDCRLMAGAAAFLVDTRWPEDLEPDRSATERENLTAANVAMRSPVSVHLRIGADAERRGALVNHAQTHDDAPLCRCSVLPEKAVRGTLAGEFKFFPGSAGMVHMVQQYRLSAERPLTVACAAGLTSDEADGNLAGALSDTAVERSEAAWTDYFNSVPRFDCSDPFLTNAYWYRWYGMRLNTVDMPNLPSLPYPFVTEGVGFFRNFVSYSAQAHLKEALWMRSPNLAIGILDNLVRCQREDGSYPGHNYSGRPARDFYHADFGVPAVTLKSVHPGAVRTEHVDSLSRYAGYYETHRLTRHVAGDVYDVFDQNETGQEYMSRYLFARPDADEWGGFRVGGVDATAYVADLQHSLAILDPARREQWESALNRTLAGLSKVCWEPDARFFCDVAPDGRRSPERPATGFYPLRIASVGSLRASTPNLVESVRRLLDPADFWLEKGFPATAKTDPTYRAEAEWKERRLNCPWNGRSWPMANSHLVDALAQAARVLDASLRPKAGEALMKAVRMLFHDGDPARPCCYEHYNPETGVPALYRGYDDYMHSWVVDLIIRHAVGVQPTEGGCTVDPLPLDVERLECEGIPDAGGRVSVCVANGKATVERER